MSDITPYTAGAGVSCTDGVCGRLIRVLVEPEARAVAHLVVGTKHGTPRLVPVDLVATGDAHRIWLKCDLDWFGRLEAAEATEVLPAPYDQTDPSRATYSPLTSRAGNAMRTVTYDVIPDGEAEIRPGEAVHAADGDIGHMQGLAADSNDNTLTHVLLAEGHLWNKKDVAIPARAVTKIGGGVHINLTKSQVKDLPPATIATVI